MNKQINQVVVDVISDNTIALLKCVPYELANGFLINEEIIRISINQKGVKNNINWAAIKKAVNQVIATQIPLNNLIISKATYLDQKIYLPGLNKFHSVESFKKYIFIWAQVRDVFKKDFKCERQLPAFFYSEKEIVFELYFAKAIDVYGNEHILSKDIALPACDDTFEYELTHEKITHRAKISGFLVVPAKNLWGIYNPININADKTLLTLRFYPITFGEKAFHLFLKEIMNKYGTVKSPDFSVCGAPKLITHILIEGSSPVIGRNAEVNWIFLGEEHRSEIANETFNFQEIAPFKKIRANTLIAIKTLHIPGRDGVDIFGNILPGFVGKDTPIFVDENVVIKDFESEKHYYSAIDGIFFKINNSISIENAFLLESDLDSSTGDLNLDCAVVIIGNIKAGMSIKCKNKLYINGSVENGCKITCDGDISIAFGVVGENTLVQAKGYCEVGFVIDAKIISFKDLVVFKYAHNPKLFSRGVIEIKGLGIKSQKCALIGGIVNSLIKIVVHSIGSYQICTNIILGKDLNIENQIVDLKKVLPSLNLNLIELNKKVGFLYTLDNEGLIKMLTPEVKAMVKNVLPEIKNIQARELAIKTAIIKFEQMLHIDDLYKVELQILNRLEPEVYIKINNYKLIIKEEISSNVLIRLVNNDICILNSEKAPLLMNC
jgi:uncharacterized protein (DUF342 family)